jgi:hypothetical protein
VVRVAVAVVVLALVACGECPSSRVLQGTVVDARGRPLSSVRVRIVDVANDDRRLQGKPRETFTDEHGAFTLGEPEVMHDQVACDLADVELTRDGCGTRTVRPTAEHTGPRAPIVLTCS